MSNLEKKSSVESRVETKESFLIRVWREPSEEVQDLRVFTRQLRTGEQVHFAELEELEPYLRSKVRESAPLDDSD